MMAPKDSQLAFGIKDVFVESWRRVRRFKDTLGKFHNRLEIMFIFRTHTETHLPHAKDQLTRTFTPRWQRL